MQRLRQWVAVAGVVGALCGLGVACEGSDGDPSASEREGRSELLRNLIASRERAPDSDAMLPLGSELSEVEDPGAAPGQDRLNFEQPADSVLGKVAWVGDNELLIRDTGGVERDVRLEHNTRFYQGDRQVSRRQVGMGAEVRASYDVVQGEWVARVVELLPAPVAAPPAASPAPR